MPFDQSRSNYLNPVTGRTFTGEKNLEALSNAGKGFHWATFNQWKQSGRSVQKGEKGIVLFGRGFTFRVFEESQTQTIEAKATNLAPVVAVPVDRDTLALSAWYLCDAARVLYWAGHADSLDRDMASKSDAILAKATANRVERETGRTAAGILGAFARKLYLDGTLAGLIDKAKATVRPVKVVRQRKAKIAKTPEAPAGAWSVHPVTGWSIRLPVGVSVSDLPHCSSPEAMKAVRKEYAKHGRIGAANTLVALEREGLKSDAASYRKGMQSRRSESGEGAVSYSYGPKSIDVAMVLEAVEYRDDGTTRAIGLR